MADIVKIALVGAGAYLVYEFFLKPASGAAHSSGTPASTPPPNPNAITGANTIDGVYAKMVAAAPSGSHAVDDWNSYLMTAMQGVKSGWVAPDPMPIFTAAVTGFDRGQQLTAGQYWSVMAPWLKTNAGLSGLGLRGLGMMYEVAR